MADSLSEQMASKVRRAEQLREEASALVREAVRIGTNAGMSQRAIATIINRSQPEVARLQRFNPGSDAGRKLLANRDELAAAAAGLGFTNPRVYGAVARGEEGRIDLLFTPGEGVGLAQVGRLQAALESLLGQRVDVTTDDRLPAHLRSRIMEDAIRL
jgi:predicted nucleotidyltransferase